MLIIDMVLYYDKLKVY